VAPVFQEQLPPGVRLLIRGERAQNIRDSFHDIEFTTVTTLALVILVIFLFVRNFSATVIPAMALPFSILGTLSMMYLLHFTLNNISMMALILSAGATVVDIVNGMRPKIANIVGLRVSFSIPPPIRISGYPTGQLRLHTAQSGYRGALPRSHRAGASDRASARAALHVDWEDVANMLYDAYGPQLVSTIYGTSNQYRVLLEVLPRYQRFEDSLKMLHLKSDIGHSWFHSMQSRA